MDCPNEATYPTALTDNIAEPVEGKVAKFDEEGILHSYKGFENFPYDKESLYISHTPGREICRFKGPPGQYQ